ncbi:MAG: Asp-tRNA(Asn)/Glu-tRNA(Gln) amidotransferase subunit GatA [Acidobacteriota bacterium]|nr:Asp-tRNA(Asn)/Glu-tRNA(Gln) amidotransferase subunit GatA [Blastocatellia bacterium]MDW8412343.1 Asp-tRNA(Asn)/Glu-tRNA(Gln) amidotransferase subunit GatA [Acidobacteriota bacterium]
MDVSGLTIEGLHRALEAREVTVEEICKAIFERIERLNTTLNVYITVTYEQAIERARELDAQLSTGYKPTGLYGVPVAIKDNICTKGIRTTCASRILENFVPPYSATAVEKLHAAGAVILGKTNCDEFAMGSSNENSAFGPVRNPWDLSRVPGGSSGGSAAAVAADLCVVALGSDTGGSVREPASFCGVVGLKPTYGRVSRYGLVAYGSSLDQIGPIAKTTADVARTLQVIAGWDEHDATSANLPIDDYLAALNSDVQSLRLGVPKEAFGVGLAPEVKRAVETAIANFETMGASLVEVTLPHLEYAIADYYIIATAEASANLARFDGVRYGYRAEGVETLAEMYQKTRDLGFGAEVKRRIMLGTYVLSSGYYDAYYLKAQKVRTLLEQDFRNAFTACDLIVTPTAPTPAFKLGEKISDPLEMYLADIYTVTINLAGLPAVSFPCGFSSDGLPIGCQLIAPHFQEARLLAACHQYEQNYPTAHPSARTSAGSLRWPSL